MRNNSLSLEREREFYLFRVTCKISCKSFAWLLLSRSGGAIGTHGRRAMARNGMHGVESWVAHRRSFILYLFT